MKVKKSADGDLVFTKEIISDGRGGKKHTFVSTVTPRYPGRCGNT